MAKFTPVTPFNECEHTPALLDLVSNGKCGKNGTALEKLIIWKLIRSKSLTKQVLSTRMLSFTRTQIMGGVSLKIYPTWG